ncbi:MAG TPA: methyltransferase domain-containing protein [Tepidisphaeraceae bacterium]|nr:methyltransferase domain-containing protein [Tepidisphaeraceae bacterium]
MTRPVDWKCPSCRESNPANFDLCWNCGSDRAGVADPAFRPAIAFHPVCETCGYLLVGLSENRCPECGHPFDPAKKDTPRALPAGVREAADAAAVMSTRDGYDRWARVYDDDGNPLIALEEPLVDRLLGEVRGLGIADIGCGTGRHAIRLAQAGASVRGIDFSSAMLERARQKAGALPIQFTQHDLALPLPFAERRFDRVVCGLVVDHIADLTGLFGEMRRICRADGFVIISVMHPAMMLRGVQARFRDPETGQEVRPASCEHQISDYVTAVTAAGLEIVQLSEHAVDEALANRLERARRYLGWPMLFLMQLKPASS